MKEKIVSVISGGIDSVSFTAQYLNKYHVYCLAFNYGQKGLKEISQAEKIMQKHGCKEFHKLDISFMKQLWKNNQLTDNSNIIKDSYDTDVVVPIRNAIFLTIATAYAYSIGANKVIYGSHLNDIANHIDGIPLYPDCSPKFASILEEALYIGHQRLPRITIESPASLGLTKSQLIKKGFDILKDDIFNTWSCYYSAGIHCGKCESCNNRKIALKEASINDKTTYKII
ncbi:MAG: 7-cyano-7-deazaguanine synthase [Candidatus Omnitrophota bacterium]